MWLRCITDYIYAFPNQPRQSTEEAVNWKEIALSTSVPFMSKQLADFDEFVLPHCLLPGIQVSLGRIRAFDDAVIHDLPGTGRMQTHSRSQCDELIRAGHPLGLRRTPYSLLPPMREPLFRKHDA
jgi:hypothetical protein